ncbi:hypothetical protein L1887_35859 [Cichorium endivia]|nr:hypothetical protein L1887_35859 [Cichorium endivia]
MKRVTKRVGKYEIGRTIGEGARNILLDSAGQLKVSGFGLIRLSKISPNKERLLRPVAIDRTNLYIAPEIYKDELFDRGADAYSFGFILYEMMEGVQPFHPDSPEEVLNLMCVDVKRPPFKTKSKYYPPNLKALIEECWYPDLATRPKFSEIIIRLDKIVGNCTKQGWWKDAFKFPWQMTILPLCRTMTTFMAPPPVTTFLAFHPQDNNIIAIGMDDSSIQIYNVRVDEVKTKLKGHHKRITGLAFSNLLNVLVSSGADSQLCVWNTNGWEKQTSKHLQIPAGRLIAPKERRNGRLLFTGPRCPYSCVKARAYKVSAAFKQRYGGGKADTAVAKSLNKEFGLIMKEHMQYIIEHADEIEKLIKVKAQVSEVKSIMLDTIDKAIDRRQNLTTLNDKAENLRDSVGAF